MATVTSVAASRNNTWTYSPQCIPGLCLWLDAADPATVTGTTSVTAWKDKSGTGNHMSVTGGTVSYASKKMTFPSGGIMTSANSTAMTGGMSVVFIRYQMTTFTGNANNANLNDVFVCPGTSGDYGIRHRLSKTQLSYVTNDLGVDLNLGNYYVNGSLGVPSWASGTITIPADPNIVYVRFNNSITTKFTLSTASSGRYFIGDIYEVIVYTGPITATQRQQVEGYLAYKWGQKSTLPPAHPYYAPNSIPVNRPFYPTDIAGLKLWLDGADRNSMTFSSGNSVSTWKDKSGQGLDVSTTSNFPTFTSTGVQFGGTVASTVLSNATGYVPTSAGLTCFVVYNSTLSSTEQQYFICAKNGSYLNWAGSTTNITVGTASVNKSQTLTYTPNTTTLVSGVTYSATNVSWATNGTESSTWTTSAVGASYQGVSALQVGGVSKYFTGFIMEILMYDAPFSEPQRLQVESYLAWKWGINVNLPTGHSGKLLPAFGAV